MPQCMQRPLSSLTELVTSATGWVTLVMGVVMSATPQCTLPLLQLPCTPRLPRLLLWLFTTITPQQLLPNLLLLLPTPRPTTMSLSLTPPMPSPMELEAAQTARSTPTRSSPTATSTPSQTPRRTTTSTQLSPMTGPGCEADPTPSPCRTQGSSTWSTPPMRTATLPL